MKYFMVNGNGKIDMQFCVPKHNFDMQNLLNFNISDVHVKKHLDNDLCTQTLVFDSINVSNETGYYIN